MQDDIYDVDGRRLPVSPEFLRDLLLSDDWSLILKLHALVETAITDLLISASSHPELDDDIGRLLLRAKITWVHSMKLIPTDSLEYIEALSVVRNRIAHRVRSIPGFSVPIAVRALDSGLRRKLLHAWADRLDDDTIRFALWMFAVMVAVQCERANKATATARTQSEDRIFADRLALQEEVERQVIGALLRDTRSTRARP
jgi:hypothetical protein